MTGQEEVAASRPSGWLRLRGGPVTLPIAAGFPATRPSHRGTHPGQDRGFLLSNSKSRRDKLTVDKLTALAGLGLEWAATEGAA
ncbi:hypothetical protein ACFYPA_29290 [Streptomyces sp. NPDC005775]|uniref:hypothetical protein n=1 Tax=Streptomyces sp. NPDC005775 TaxID=3364729 RepID=UPI0036A1AADC